MGPTFTPHGGRESCVSIRTWVVNILSKFLNGPTVPHVRLSDLVEGVPDDATKLLTAATRRRDYDVTVVGYPGGHLTLLGT